MAVTTRDLRGVAHDATHGGNGALRPSVRVSGPYRGDVPIGGPYDTRAWKGMTVHQCPECPFPGTSSRAVDRHREAEHPIPPSTAERAAASGIIVATR